MTGFTKCKAYTLCIQRNGNYFSLSHKWLGRIPFKFCAPIIHTNVKKDVCKIVPVCILRIQSYQHHHMSSSYNALFWYPLIFLLNAWFVNKPFTPFLYYTYIIIIATTLLPLNIYTQDEIYLLQRFIIIKIQYIKYKY